MSTAGITGGLVDPRRFDNGGIFFKGKLIGVEEVRELRGDLVCQVAMARLKATVVALKQHKQPINIIVSMDGVKIVSDRLQELYYHPVHLISFIHPDAGDARACGYIFEDDKGGYHFIAIKTEKAAADLVSCLRDIFDAVCRRKKRSEVEEPTPKISLSSQPATGSEKKSSSPLAVESRAEHDGNNNQPYYRNPPPFGNDEVINNDINLEEFQNPVNFDFLHQPALFPTFNFDVLEALDLPTETNNFLDDLASINIGTSEAINGVSNPVAVNPLSTMDSIVPQSNRGESKPPLDSSLRLDRLPSETVDFINSSTPTTDITTGTRRSLAMSQNISEVNNSLLFLNSSTANLTLGGEVFNDMLLASSLLPLGSSASVNNAFNQTNSSIHNTFTTPAANFRPAATVSSSQDLVYSATGDLF